MICVALEIGSSIHGVAGLNHLGLLPCKQLNNRWLNRLEIWNLKTANLFFVKIQLNINIFEDMEWAT